MGKMPFDALKPHPVVDRADLRILALLFSATWSDPALDSAVEKFFQQVGEEITQKAREMGHGYDFAYLNDAGGAGNPFVTYGKGSSLPELKRIAKEFGECMQLHSPWSASTDFSSNRPFGCFSDPSSWWVQAVLGIIVRVVV